MSIDAENSMVFVRLGSVAVWLIFNAICYCLVCYAGYFLRDDDYAVKPLQFSAANFNFHVQRGVGRPARKFLIMIADGAIAFSPLILAVIFMASYKELLLLKLLHTQRWKNTL